MATYLGTCKATVSTARGIPFTLFYLQIWLFPFPWWRASQCYSLPLPNPLPPISPTHSCLRSETQLAESCRGEWGGKERRNRNSKKGGKENPLHPKSQPPSPSLLITRTALQSFSKQTQPPISSFFFSHLTLSTNTAVSDPGDLLLWHRGAQPHPGWSELLPQHKEALGGRIHLGKGKGKPVQKRLI